MTLEHLDLGVKFQELARADDQFSSDIIAQLRFSEEGVVWIMPKIDHMKSLSITLQSSFWMDVGEDVGLAAKVIEFAVQGCDSDLDMADLGFYRGNCLMLSGDVNGAITEYEALPLLSSTQQFIGRKPCLGIAPGWRIGSST